MKVRIWDLPTRIFHWLLVAAITISFVSVNIGGNAMIWHQRAGFLVLALILFRVVWGFVGSHYARFVHFVVGLKDIKAYLKNPQEVPGHNPMGSISVILLLTFVFLQAFTGLFTSDEIAFDGPLVKYVSNAVVDTFSLLHESGESVLYVLISLHLLAIVYYKLVKRVDLVRPMITGDKDWRESVPVAKDDWKIRLMAAVLFATIYFGVNYFLLR